MTRGGIYLRGKTFWVRYSFKGRERCETSRSTDRKDAERLLAKRLGEIGADVAGIKRWVGPEGERTQITKLLDDLMSLYEVEHSRSLRTMECRHAALSASFDRERAGDVDAARLRRYVLERERQGRQPATIQAELAFFHRAFVVAQQDGLISHVPKVPQIHVDNARQGFFEQADFEAVVAHLPAHLKDPARFAYLSGWRKQEILDLTWKEVDLRGKVIKLDPARDKGKKGRTLALVGELWEIIERRAEDRRVDRPLLATICPFVFHREGNQIKQMIKPWKVACRKAGVAGLLFHDLRRTTVRNMVRAGVPEVTVMKVTGHRSRTVFDRYNIVNDADIREAQENMQLYLRATHEERTIVPMEGRG